MKLVINKYFIPNIVTLSSILAGFIAIIMSGYGEFKFAASMIILGVFFDSLDGMLARKLKASNAYGREIDSIADAITFGVAPGYLLYQATLYKFGNLGLVAAGLVPISAALRLARFNLKPTTKFFQGLPSTSAGLSIALLQGYYNHYFSPIFYLLFSLIVSLLMISKIKYYKPDWGYINYFIKHSPIPFALLLILLILFFKWTLFSLIIFYIISGILNSIKYKTEKNIEKIKINS